MKTFYYLLIVVLFVGLLHNASADSKPLSGQAKLDSLLAELPNAKGDTNEVNLLSAISFTYYSINPNKGIEYGKRGVILSKKIGWEKGLSYSYNSIGVNFQVLSNYSKALEYYQKSLRLNEAINNKLGSIKNLNNIGNIFYYQSNFPKALEYYFKTLKFYEELDTKKGFTVVLNNIGMIYFYQSNFPKALEYFQKALKLNKEQGSKQLIATNLNNIGNNYYYQSNFPKALEYFQKALSLNNELHRKSEIALNLGNIGSIYSTQFNYPKALEYYQKALSLNDELDSKSEIADNFNNIGSLYFQLSQDTIIKRLLKENNSILLDKFVNLNLAIEYSNKAIDISNKIGNITAQIKGYNVLYEAYKQKGEFKKSLQAYEEYTKLKDSVFSEENRDKIAALEKAREDDVNRIKIEKQKVQIAAQKKEKSYIIYGSAGALLSVLLILGLVFYQRKKSDKLLHNVLPITIADRLKKKEHPISDYFEQASIVFIDIVGFTSMSKDIDPQVIVSSLNQIFTKYDTIADKYGLEKIKTIGDSYMAAAGLPVVQEDNSHRAAKFALEVKEMMKDYHTSDGTRIEVRIGLDCGPVVAGVIGEKKFIYDMWSDAVNTASRMESSGQAGEVQVSDRFKEAVTQYQEFTYVERGEMEIKGKGKMKTYFMSER